MECMKKNQDVKQSSACKESILQNGFLTKGMWRESVRNRKYIDCSRGAFVKKWSACNQLLSRDVFGHTIENGSIKSCELAMWTREDGHETLILDVQRSCMQAA